MPPRYAKKSYPKKSASASSSLASYNSNYTAAKYLIIVESPSKCQKIENFLGEKYRCIASRGHIRGLLSLKDIDTKSGTYTPTFTILTDKAAWVKEMSAIISMFPKENVLLATDDDREGEAISAHICDVFELSLTDTHRVLFREITKEAIYKAVITDPHTRINIPLVQSQYARQILDVLVGFKVSPLLWKHIYHAKSNSLSAGRCQTPALRLVYDNYKAGELKVPEYNYSVLGEFFPPPYSLEFTLDKQYNDTEKIEEFLTLSKDFPFQTFLGEKRETVKHPPNPFNTSNLLQSASNSLGLSPKHTMGLLQILYQDGHITYIRTENTKYAKEFLLKAGAFITTKYGEKSVGDLTAVENKDETNPHEAVRVTHIECAAIETEDSKLGSLYKLIWRNTVESCMSLAKYNCYRISIPAPTSTAFHHTLEIPVFMGWKVVSSSSLKSDISLSPASVLFYIQSLAKSKITFQSIYTTMTVSNTHSHYTEAALISKLEELGIGRPSTFAQLVDTIIERGYVSKEDIVGKSILCIEYLLKHGKMEKQERTKIFGNEKGKLVIQPIGELCIQFLIEHFNPLFEYSYTKNMEEDLDAISKKSYAHDWSHLCKTVDLEIKSYIKLTSKIEKQQYPLSDGKHEFIFTKFGGSIRNIHIADPTLDNHGDKTGNNTFEYEYLPVKKDVTIDLAKMKRGEYSLNELLETPNSLGKFKDCDVFLKNGQYGYYLMVMNGVKKPTNIKINLPPF